MPPSRRRRLTRSGIPLAVVIAFLSAIFASRAARAPAAARTPARSDDIALSAPSSSSPREDRADRSASPRSAPTSAASPGFASGERLREHYGKHGQEFPGLSIEAYLLAAQTLRDAPAGNTVLELRRRDGIVTRFDRGSGAFLAVNRDGTIRTFFRPNDGETYFRRQASRTPGGGP